MCISLFKLISWCTYKIFLPNYFSGFRLNDENYSVHDYVLVAKDDTESTSKDEAHVAQILDLYDYGM